MQRLEASAGLDGELVEREVVGSERERPVEFRLPLGQLLARAGIDQVEGEAREQGAGELERGERVGG